MVSYLPFKNFILIIHYFCDFFNRFWEIFRTIYFPPSLKNRQENGPTLQELVKVTKKEGNLPLKLSDTLLQYFPESGIMEVNESPAPAREIYYGGSTMKKTITPPASAGPEWTSRRISRSATQLFLFCFLSYKCLYNWNSKQDFS